jgi:far upstream element-binding protein
MSPAHLQQAQQVAAQVAARLGQPPSNYQNATIPNPEAVEKAKQLINKFIPQGQGGGGGGGGNGNGGGGQSSQPRAGLGSNAYTEIMIPGPKVGLIIGKGGLTIKQLQEKTGAKMIIIQDNPNPEMEKPLRISGDPQNVEHAKQLVFELMQDKGNEGNQQQSNNRNSYSNSNHGAAYPSGGGGRNNGGGGGDQIEVFVPKAAVGVVIGKEGGMIKKIQADTGCKLQFLQSKGEGLGDRQCIVQGTKQQVEDGKRMIEDLIDSVLRRNNNSGGGNDNWNGNGNSGYQQQSHQQSQQSMGGGGGSGVQVVQQQYEFNVPTSKCGIIIGRGGDTIKQINQQSGAHCEMDRKKSANQTNEKTFSIRGDQHQIDEAKRLIQEKINMDVDLQHIGAVTVNQPASSGGYGQSSQNPYQAWGASGYNQGWDQNQGGGPMQGGQPSAMGGGDAASGQPDYSLQWIEYYRSMGMHQQAEAIEAQIKGRPSGGASTPGMTPGKYC